MAENDVENEIFNKVREYYQLAHKKSDFIPGSSERTHDGQMVSKPWEMCIHFWIARSLKMR